jgi:general secretion pathway protein D
MRKSLASSCVLAFAWGLPPAAAPAQEPSAVVARNDSVLVRFVDTDLRVAVQALAPYLDRPLIIGAMGDFRVTLTTPRPLARAAIPELLDGMLRSFNLGLQSGPGHYAVGGNPLGPVAAAPNEVSFFVVRLRHARAPDVAATVNALYGQASALGEIRAPRPTLAGELRQSLIPPAGAETPNPSAAVVPGMAQLSGQVTIVPDTRTNSLLIRASGRDFELLQAAIDKLDVRALQVLIEVVIVEVRRDRSLSYGLEAILPRTRVPGTSATEVSAGTSGIGLGDFVVSVLHLAGADVSATLRAASSRGAVSILSRPVVLAANNETAEIMVGSQRPFIQVQRALPTDAPVRDQVVQFKDVGTRLTVVPTVSEDGYVTMQVAQEVNAATAEVAFDAPVISTRSITTQLLVKDGHTAVLGGLMDRQRESVRAGIPFLSELPVIGGLFGRQTSRSTDTELFVFLTPRVIRSDDEMDAMSRSIGDRTQSLRARALPAPPAGPPAAPATPPADAGSGAPRP